MDRQKIIIGSRGSKLALIQAEMVKKQLIEMDKSLDPQIKVFTTRGDKDLETPLTQIGEKGLFTEELEEALIEGEIDLAVHSLKDLPTQLPRGIGLGAVLQREDPRDALLSPSGRSFDQLGEGARIATSSLRRKAQIKRLYPKANVLSIRGNIDTRIAKMMAGYCEGLVLAHAGLIRAGLEEHISQVMDYEEIMPAVCQGIIGMEISQENEKIKDLMEAINHKETWIMTLAERSFLRELEGGCQIPVGCHSIIKGDQIQLLGRILDLDGKTEINSELVGSIEDAEILGKKLADELLLNGGRTILESIERGE